MPAKSIRPVRVAIYSRVSTDHQTTENQKREGTTLSRTTRRGQS